jgi:hypothetical protein
MSSGISALKFEMLIRKDPVAQHEARTGLYDVLRQESCREIGGSLPYAWVQARVESGELGPESH